MRKYRVVVNQEVMGSQEMFVNAECLVITEEGMANFIACGRVVLALQPDAWFGVQELDRPSAINEVLDRAQQRMPTEYTDRP